MKKCSSFSQNRKLVIIVARYFIEKVLSLTIVIFKVCYLILIEYLPCFHTFKSATIQNTYLGVVY